MATRLDRKAPGAKGVERAVTREIEKTLEVLGQGRPLSDEAVHIARKRLKRARAGLRLEREALGEQAYRRENRALRDIGRPLSEVRDSVVLLEAFDALGLDGGGEPARIRKRLVEQHAASRRKVLEREQGLGPALTQLRAVGKRIAGVKARRHGWQTIGPGVRRTYRAGRRAYAAARKKPTPERLHEWRKQTKYLWHVLQLLEPIWPKRLGPLGRRVHRLSTQLGDDHDLVVLRARAAKRPAVDPTTRDVALKTIDRRRQALQKRAMALGAIIYSDRPRTLERRLHRRWRAWRST